MRRLRELVNAVGSMSFRSQGVTRVGILDSVGWKGGKCWLESGRLRVEMVEGSLLVVSNFMA